MGAKLGIVVAAMALIGAHYTMNSRQSISESGSRISDAQYEVLARSAALTGFERAKQSLASSFSPGEITGDVDGISYRTTTTISGNIARVVSTGTYSGVRSDSSRTYEIIAEFEQGSSTTTTSPLPDFMGYALLADDDLRLSGSAGTTHIYSSAPGAANLNANVHTNGDLTVNGKGSDRMKGFGTYSGSASGKHRNTKFQPNYNPDGLDHTYQSASVSIPTIDVSAIASSWSPDYTITSGTISGAQSYGGTRDNPAIVHVPANLDISGTISGYVIFLVEGDITVRGNTTVGSSGYSGGDESSVAFYGEGDFDMTGGSDVWGQVVVNGDFEMGGNARLYGSAVTGSGAWMHGTPNIYYREASAALTQVFEPAPSSGAIEMVAYGEF